MEGFKKTTSPAKAITVHLFDTDMIIVTRSGFAHAPYLVTFLDAFESCRAGVMDKYQLIYTYKLKTEIMKTISQELGL